MHFSLIPFPQAEGTPPIFPIGLRRSYFGNPHPVPNTMPGTQQVVNKYVLEWITASVYWGVNVCQASVLNVDDLILFKLH